MTRSEDAGSANVTVTVTADDGSGTPVTVTANGAFDQTAADLTIDASGALANTNLPAGSGNIELRLLDQNGDPVVYAHSPALASIIPGGQSWVELDVAQAAKALGVDLGGSAATTTQNPTDVLGLLHQLGSVESLGPETINGVSTTGYRATIDLSQVSANRRSRRADVRAAPARERSIHLDPDRCVDRRRRPRLPGRRSTRTTPNGSANVTVDLSNYGTPVTVEAPPASDTFDATGLVKDGRAEWPPSPAPCIPRLRPGARRALRH